MNLDEYDDYLNYTIKVWDDQDIFNTKKARGLAEGMKEVMLHLLKMNIDINLIATATNLSLKQIKLLKSSTEKVTEGTF